MSTNDVIGRGPSRHRSRGKHIRHALIIILVVLLSHRQTGFFEDRMDLIGGADQAIVV
jgi:hypothetical protein